MICEKPLVLNEWNIDGITELEKKTGCHVNTILQLRLHPEIQKLKEIIQNNIHKKKYEIELTYIAPRGNWYKQSWKGDEKKSGGIVTNIGIHFFDVLHFLFGKTKTSQINFNSDFKAAGFIELENANVRWFLSVDKDDLKYYYENRELETYRSIKLDGTEIDFSKGFEDLHLQSYRNILNNKGFRIEETREAIKTVANIRKILPVGKIGYDHPLINKIS